MTTIRTTPKLNDHIAFSFDFLLPSGERIAAGTTGAVVAIMGDMGEISYRVQLDSPYGHVTLPQSVFTTTINNGVKVTAQPQPDLLPQNIGDTVVFNQGFTFRNRRVKEGSEGTVTAIRTEPTSINERGEHRVFEIHLQRPYLTFKVTEEFFEDGIVVALPAPVVASTDEVIVTILRGANLYSLAWETILRFQGKTADMPLCSGFELEELVWKNHPGFWECSNSRWLDSDLGKTNDRTLVVDVVDNNGQRFTYCATFHWIR